MTDLRTSQLLFIGLWLAAALAFSAREAFAVPIPITNASFENPAITPSTAGHNSHVIPAGWTGNNLNSGTGPGTSYIIRNLLYRFPDYYPGSAPEGTQWVQLLTFNTGSTPQNVMYQNLGTAVGAGMYTFSVYAGFDLTSDGAQNNAGGRAQVFGNGGTGSPLVTLEFPKDTLLPGEFKQYSGNFTVPAGDPIIGTNLVVTLECDRAPLDATFSRSVISFDSVSLDFTPAVLPPSSDFDGDGDVDGADFLTWQRGLGLTGQSNSSTGDATGDGNVNGADLAEWKAHFGGTPATAAVGTVPEPASWALLILGGALLGRRATIARAKMQ